MKNKPAVFTILLLLASFLPPSPAAWAVNDGYYDLSEVAYTWDGTSASRTQAVTADYNYNYGDEASQAYTLPWTFYFYGQAYNSINADANGNIWFSSTGAAHSFSLANTGRGRVIAAWNNDLSSQFYGGFFIQRKTNPDRVVVEWQTETYTDEGSHILNNFEVVIFKGGGIRIDYKTMTPANAVDFGSGISKDDNQRYIVIGNVYNLTNRSYLFRSIPDISPVPSSYNFGNAYVNRPSSTTITVSNPSVGPLVIGSANIAGTHSAMFTKTVDNCSGTTLSPGASCTILLSFTPTSLGAKTATLSILSNDHDTPVFDIPLSGNGVNPQLTVTIAGSVPGSVSSNPAGITSCTSQCTGSFSTGQTVTLTANSSSSAALSGWSLPSCTGTGPCQFQIQADMTVTATFNCTTPAVKIQGRAGGFATLQPAYDAAVEGDVILSRALTFTENLTTNRSIGVTFDGGYVCDYSSKPDKTSVKGKVWTDMGRVKLKNFKVQQ